MTIAFSIRKKAGKKGHGIRCFINHNGRAYYNTKLFIQKAHWGNGKVKESYPNANLYNSRLTQIRNEVDAICNLNPKLKVSEVIDLIDKGSSVTFVSYFQKIIDDSVAGKLKRESRTVDKYREVLRALTEFGIDFNLDKRWYDSYVGEMRKKGKGENTIGNHIKIVKMVLRAAHEDGVSTNIEYSKKYFKKPYEETDSIYLTSSDILKWEQIDLINSPHLLEERDRFLVQYYLLLRFGDTLLFDKSSFFIDKKTFLRMRAEKSNIEMVVPVNTKALKILKKYDFKFGKISNQEANWKLKEIGRLCGIDQVITVGKRKGKTFEFITTHTARRSGATNLYLEGAPEKMIMDIGGWKKIETFRKYIRLSKLDSAKKAQDYEFFK